MRWHGMAWDVLKYEVHCSRLMRLLSPAHPMHSPFPPSIPQPYPQLFQRPFQPIIPRHRATKPNKVAVFLLLSRKQWRRAMMQVLFLNHEEQKSMKD
jgi:hypothetical protein